MSFNLFGRIVSWFKKIFHICPKPKCEKYTLADVPTESKPVKLAQPSETPSIRAAQVQEKPPEPPLFEEKTVEDAPLLERGTSEILSEEEPVAAIPPQGKPQFPSKTSEKQTISNAFQEQSREKILTTQRSQGSDASLKEIKAEPQIKYPIEDAKTEETIIKKEDTDSPKQQKPHIKKPSTEGKLPRKLTTSEKRPFSPKQREPIDLGATQRRRRGSIKVQGKSQSDENVEKETNDKTSVEKEFAATVEAPFVEIDLDSANVYLVLPQQQFATNTLDKTPQQLCYNLEINGGQQKILATPESTVNFQITVPRVKWKTSKQSIWGSKFQKVERNDLRPGELFCFLVKTNDFDNKYDLLAILGTNGHKLQEGKFIRKGIEYSLELNQFFDTVTHHKEDELTLRVEIRRIGDPRLLASVEAFYFEGKSKIQKKVLPAESRDGTISKFPHIQAMVKCSSRVPTGRKGKGFSKKEVIDAGIDLKDVRHLNIPYDKRRKSSHQSNINTIRRRYENDSRR